MSFFREEHIQNPLKSPVGKLYYGYPKFCIIHLFQLSLTNHFYHWNYTVAAANNLS